MLRSFHGPVAAQNPEKVRSFAKAFAQKTPVNEGVLRRKQFRAVAPHQVPFIAPCRQKREEQAQLARTIQNPVHMGKIRGVGPRRLEVVQGQIALRVGRAQAVEFGQHDGLDRRETLRGAGLQVMFRLFAAQAMEHLPGGIGEIKERFLAVAQKAVVGTDAEGQSVSRNF